MDTVNITIREQIKKDTGVDLPILGGTGNSLDDPIIIDPDFSDYTDVEYSFLKVLYHMLGKSWKVDKVEHIEHQGKLIDKLSLIITGDEQNSHNHYFEITSHAPGMKLFGGKSRFAFPWEKNPLNS